jgi:hypothetical protein
MIQRRNNEMSLPPDTGEKERWFKNNGGPFHPEYAVTGSDGVKTKIVKRNQRFRTVPSNVPKAFRDIVKPMDDLTDDDIPQAESVPTGFRIKPRGRKGEYDVVGLNGKPINDDPLSEEDSKALLEKLTEE